MAKIIVSDSDGEREVALDRDEVSIGRVSSQNDVAIKVAEASRQHCKILREGSAWFVEDLGSSNGTRVNGRRVTKFELQDGDEIQVGKATLRFLDSDVAAAPPVADEPELELEISLEEESHIRFLGTDRKGERVTLAGRVTVGSKSTNSLRLQEKGVSGSHAELVEEGGSWIVRDLGSTNGTFVNGDKVAEASLEPGDVLRFGVAQLVFGVGDDEGDEALVETVMMEDTGGLGEEVFAISEANMRRKRKAAAVLWLGFFAAIIACAVLWVMQDTETSTSSLEIKSVAGNLLTKGASFELTAVDVEADEDILTTDSDAVEYEEVTRYKHSGRYSLMVEAAGDEGVHYVSFTQEIKNISSADRLEIGGFFRTSGLTQGLGGLSLIWKDDAGRTLGASHLNAPPASSSFEEVRGVYKPPGGTDRATVAISVRGAGGKLYADDVFALRRRGEGSGGIEAHEFGVMLDPSGTLTVARDGEEVADEGGLYWTDTTTPVATRGWFYASSKSASETRLEVSGEVVRGGEQFPASFSVEVTEVGLRYEGKAASTRSLALGLAVALGEGLVTVASDGAVRHTDDFERDGVSEIVVATGHRALRIALAQPSRVALKTSRRGSVLLLPLAAGEDGSEFALDMQLDFSRERDEVTALANRARKADLTERRYGEAMRLYREIVNRYSFRKDLAEHAAERHAKMLQEGEKTVATMQDRVDDVIFFKTFATDADALIAEANVSIERYEGSAIADRLRATVARLTEARGEHVGEHHKAVAQNHLTRGIDLMEPGKSQPVLARGFFLSVKTLAPGTPMAEEAQTYLDQIKTLLSEN